MAGRVGVEAHGSDRVDVRLGDSAHQHARNVGVGGVRAAAKRFARIDPVRARQPLSEAKLERVEV